MAKEYEDKINDMIDRIDDKDMASILKVCTKNRMYPKDCLTNGSMEDLIRRVIGYEERIKELEAALL